MRFLRLPLLATVSTLLLGPIAGCHKDPLEPPAPSYDDGFCIWVNGQYICY